MRPPIRRRRHCTLSLAALLAAAPVAAWADAAPVRAVTLFEAGLAELTRETGSAREVALSVPLRDVNDVLKSLLLRGDGIEGASLRLDGAQPVEDAFASLPFPPAAATDLLTLLRSVPGLRVRVSDSAYPQGVEGTLMGVEEDCPAEGRCETTLTVLADDGGIRRHAFTPDLELAILDEAIVAALGRGLGALREAASGTMREVAVSIEGDQVQDGALTYVIAAPAWKTSYRALTGGDGAVDLQAWAVIENASGEDWEDVALTLSSGSPRTLAADLHGRTWRYRETVEPMAVAEPMMAIDQELDAAAAPRTRLTAEAFAAAPPAPIGAAAQASEGVLDSRFALDAPIDLAVGEMISLPFLADALEASHLSVYRGSLATRAGNPDMVLEIVNDLGVRLPAGIMTVSDARGGYVGDAEFPLVGPGESRAVPYGIDRRVQVEEQSATKTRQVSVLAAEGVLRITREETREVSYLVTSPSGEAREVAIDHPQQAGWETTVVSGTDAAGAERMEEDGGRWRRFVLDVAAGDGAAGDGARLVLRDARPVEEIVSIGTLDEAAILSWRGQATDAATEAYLDAAAALMRESSRAADALMDAEAEQRRLVAEQDRVRRLLASVPEPSEAHDRFLADLIALEDRIGDATDETAAARLAMERTRATFAAHLGMG